MGSVAEWQQFPEERRNRHLLPYLNKDGCRPVKVIQISCSEIANSYRSFRSKA